MNNKPHNVVYNTNFKVKYYDIQQEIIHKLETEIIPQQEEQLYTNLDVFAICEKLYRDELLSVFGMDEFSEEILFGYINNVYGSMLHNKEFDKIICETKQLIFDKMSKNQDEQHENFNQFLLLLLFRSDIFYITHKCICQHLTLNKMDDYLLSSIKNYLFEFINNN